MGKLPPICQGWREEAKRRKNRVVDNLTMTGGQGEGGVCFQIEREFDDGRPLKRVADGPFKGRIRFTSRREAKEIARRYQDWKGTQMEYDP